MYYAAQSWTTTQAERINPISVERCIIRRLKLIPEDKWLKFAQLTLHQVFVNEENRSLYALQHIPPT
uniref:Transposase n=1 Tax=Strongyloides venezuelensis TaxID=75913 RepID=A0A0K0EXZ8_STRVS